MDYLQEINKPEVSVIVSLYNCIDYLNTFFQYVEKTINKHCYEFLLLHNAPSEKELEIINNNITGKSYYRHIIIPDRESLYKTWNRGIALAKSEYLTIWNVDDIRFPESIMQQKQKLDENPDAMLAYGDIFISNTYGERGSNVTSAPIWSNQNRNEFCRVYHMTCFQMWKKSIHEVLGYYDEQFFCSGDFDFQIRTAIHFPFVKVSEPLGIYLEGTTGKISYNGKQQYENNVIFVRYGIIDKINLLTLSGSLKKYKKGKFLFYNEWITFNEKSPFRLSYKIGGFFISILKLPIYFLRYLKRKLLELLNG